LARSSGLRASGGRLASKARAETPSPFFRNWRTRW
jgi:hypothetical protein